MTRWVLLTIVTLLGSSLGHSAEYKSSVPGLRIGAGFDPFFGVIKQSNIKILKADTLFKRTDNSVWDIKLCNSRTSVLKELNIDVALNAKVIAVNGQASLNEFSDINQSSTTLVVSFKRVSGTLNLLNRPSIGKSTGLYGSEYVSQISYGSSLELVYIYTSTNDVERSQFMAKLKASFSVGSVDATMKSEVQAAKTTESLVVHGLLNGKQLSDTAETLLFPDLSDIGRVKHTIEKLVKDMSAERGAEIGFATTPYDGNSLVGPDQRLMLLYVSKYLEIDGLLQAAEQKSLDVYGCFDFASHLETAKTDLILTGIQLRNLGQKEFCSASRLSADEMRLLVGLLSKSVSSIPVWEREWTEDEDVSLGSYSRERTLIALPKDTTVTIEFQGGITLANNPKNGTISLTYRIIANGNIVDQYTDQQSVVVQTPRQFVLDTRKSKNASIQLQFASGDDALITRPNFMRIQKGSKIRVKCQ